MAQHGYDIDPDEVDDIKVGMSPGISMVVKAGISDEG